VQRTMPTPNVASLEKISRPTGGISRRPCLIGWFSACFFPSGYCILCDLILTSVFDLISDISDDGPERTDEDYVDDDGQIRFP
jgi:hypothetical protein